MQQNINLMQGPMNIKEIDMIYMKFEIIVSCCNNLHATRL
jgi:hypothetical protein